MCNEGKDSQPLPGPGEAVLARGGGRLGAERKERPVPSKHKAILGHVFVVYVVLHCMMLFAVLLYSILSWCYTIVYSILFGLILLYFVFL